MNPEYDYLFKLLLIGDSGWANPACCSGLRTIPTQSLTFPQLGSTSKSEQSSWTEKLSNCRFGTLRVRRDSGQSLLPTTEEPTASLLSTMSQTRSPLTM